MNSRFRFVFIRGRLRQSPLPACGRLRQNPSHPARPSSRATRCVRRPHPAPQRVNNPPYALKSHSHLCLSALICVYLCSLFPLYLICVPFFRSASSALSAKPQFPRVLTFSSDKDHPASDPIIFYQVVYPRNNLCQLVRISED